MNLRQKIDGVKLNWQKLNSTADITTIPFKDFSQVVVFIESNEDAETFLRKNRQGVLVRKLYLVLFKWGILRLGQRH